jgi:hypothetical protein
MTSFTQSQIDSEIEAELPTNNAGGVSAADVRGVLHDMNAATFQPFANPNTWTVTQTFNASPIVPTPGPGDNTTKAASTAFVRTAITAIPIPPVSPPGGATTQVQYNSSGAFGGDPNFTWTTGSGLISKNRMAVGSNADLTNMIQSPGDPVNAYVFPYSCTLRLNNFFSGDLSVPAGGGIASLASYSGFKHTGTANVSSVNVIDVQPSINSDSTGPITYFTGVSSSPYNYGSGNIDNYIGIASAPWVGGTGTIAGMIGVKVQNGYSQTVTNGYGVSISKPSGTHGVNSVGLDIEDHTGTGSATSYNIWSKGAASIVKLDGVIRMGTATNATPQNGDLWFDGTNLKFQVGGVTKTVTLA